jgi:CTP-dependent riboflavin kinase
MSRMPRMDRNIAIVGADGKPTEIFFRWFQRFAEAIDDNTDANAAVDTSQSELLDTLNTTVATLNDVVDELQAQRDMERTRDSQVSGLTITPGANSITISGHTRSYLDPTASVAVTGDAISGLAGATTYYIHYTDPDREGGAVGYQTSLNLEGATATLSEPHRHFVGFATTGGAATNAPAPYWRNGL